MPVETWYLSRQATGMAKRLGRLEGWRKEVAQLLLSNDNDENIKSDINKLVASQETKQDQAHIVEQTVELLPKNSRSKAKILAQHLLHHLRIDENARIVYPDGSLGSAFIDALKYFTAPRSGVGKIRAPFDVVKLSSFLRETKVPISAVSRSLDDIAEAPEKKWVSM